VYLALPTLEFPTASAHHPPGHGGTMAIDKELLEILACPKCKGDLVYKEEEQILECGACRLRYPIKDDIPIMLIDEAESF
jgi:uncharacterized protein YbaR (Trm112 family)